MHVSDINFKWVPQLPAVPHRTAGDAAGGSLGGPSEPVRAQNCEKARGSTRIRQKNTWHLWAE